MGCPGLNLIDRLVHDLRKSDGLSQETKAEDAVSYLYPFEDPSDSDVESFYIAREFYRKSGISKFILNLAIKLFPMILQTFVILKSIAGMQRFLKRCLQRLI